MNDEEFKRQRNKFYVADGRNRSFMNDNSPPTVYGVEQSIDDFIAECEKEAAKLEITVDYYLAEFV